MSKLKKQAIRGILWSFLEAVGQRGIQFIVGIILARLLLPEEFGLIGMITIFIAISQTFLDSGFGAALIQKAEISNKDTSSVFYFNIIIGIIAALTLCFVSPWVASFYDQPLLTPLLRVMSTILIINSFGLVQIVLLRKEVNFKTYTKAVLIASGLSGLIGVGMAWSGYGVWSLAFQQISAALILVILLWKFNPWRPTKEFSFSSLRQMFNFGSKLFASGLLNTIFENIYLIIIGKIFSPADLGYFTRAKNLQQLPSRTISGIVARVAFPVFSKIQDDTERIKRGMKKALTVLVFINFPLMVGLAITAKPVVIVLLTEKWLPCVKYLQLLCMVGMLFPLHLINLNVLQAMGKSDLFLRLEIIKKVLTTISICITWRWGISAMIIGQIITSLFSYYLNAYYNRRLVNYSIWEQIHDLAPYLFNAIIMGCTCQLINLLPFTNSIFLLLLQVTAGIFVYILLCHKIKLAAYVEIKQLFFQYMPIKTRYSQVK